MRRPKHPSLRNKLDFADSQQVRLLKKRLGVSADVLLRTVEKVGNSIAAISKEVELQKASAIRGATRTLPVLNPSVEIELAPKIRADHTRKATAR